MKLPSLSRIRRHLLHHPLIIVPVLVVVLIFAWQQYIAANRNLNYPSGANLLNVSYESSPAKDSILGWKVSHNGNATYTSQQTQGLASDKAIKVSVTSYGSGDITLAGPKVSLETNKDYLFKGYYTSTTSFTLLAHYYYSDGTNQLTQLETYPAKRDGWTTASHAFASKDIASVQFVYKITNPGELSVDGIYLEPKNEISLLEEIPPTKNLVPNNALSASGLNMPDDWISYQAGDNTAAFSYLNDNKGAYLKTSVKDFRTGEAKWQYATQPVTPFNRYKFRVNYQSDSPVNIIAEYVLKDGGHYFETVGILSPAGQWTVSEQFLEAPAGATTLNISLVLNSNGSLLSREHSLENITKPGIAKWSRPLVSITFDDGWRSAYTQAIPVLNSYGYKGTFYITPSIIETPHFMSAANLTTLSKSGHEIAAHGYSHTDMTMMSQNALNNQLSQGKTYLTDVGFSANNLAAPYGKSDAEVEWFAKKYFTTIRGADTGTNTKQNINPHNLKAFVIHKDTSQDALKELLEQTKKTNGWLILVYHNVNSGGNEISSTKADNSTITTKTFTDQIAELRKSNITVLPVETAFKEVSGQ
jgi:peptidoglycan/xylan/chitin deacetylase (PgdA/CDA1 family)